MGFNKKFISEEVIIKTFDRKETLKSLFSADSLLFMDEMASEVFRLHKEGLCDTKIKLYIDGKKNTN